MYEPRILHESVFLSHASLAWVLSVSQLRDSLCFCFNWQPDCFCWVTNVDNFVLQGVHDPRVGQGELLEMGQTNKRTKQNKANKKQKVRMSLKPNLRVLLFAMNHVGAMGLFIILTEAVSFGAWSCFFVWVQVSVVSVNVTLFLQHELSVCAKDTRSQSLAELHNFMLQNFITEKYEYKQAAHDFKRSTYGLKPSLVTKNHWSKRPF